MTRRWVPPTLLGALAATGALAAGWWRQPIPAAGLAAAAGGLWYWAAVRCIPPRRKPRKFKPLTDEERATFDAIAAALKSERAKNGGDS